MKALVTGCAGFIGSHLAERLLREGFEVFGIDCFTDYYPKEVKEGNLEKLVGDENFLFIEADLLSLKEFPRVDYVFHLAAQPGVRQSWRGIDAYIANNIMSTERLLEFYKGERLEKFVYASSSSVYGEGKLPMSETDLTRPLSPYGVTKLAAENLCYLFWKNFGIPAISLRYFTVYGERQRPDMAIYKFIKAMLSGDRIVIFGDGSQTRDFTYVGDVIEATLLAARSGLSGEVLNVGSGRRISINDLIALLEKILGKKGEVERVGAEAGDVSHTQADTARINELLGWRPKIEIEEGLRRQVEWMRSNSP